MEVLIDQLESDGYDRAYMKEQIKAAHGQEKIKTVFSDIIDSIV